ncbi:DUF1003 domain-containing protein [Pseudoclavibacter sp. RFBG4]|uniref:DUF1003 domain-containing protein n=1 Tax=unclassified Pseudoclavibacter TaxID=2615177 RepID=UPI000CE90CE1|nr:MULTISPECIES: DUF1003 domain-containing protein [unclassified Pseudoclavibacter]MBF4459779.1 DUF1003 domain-containing protein [Pseudoclavibacter sp. VKM Ac-2867]PPG31821.1 DUF1003 domain-containing protein [Pseudoclavibacter sp. RFBG4]
MARREDDLERPKVKGLHLRRPRPKPRRDSRDPRDSRGDDSENRDHDRSDAFGRGMEAFARAMGTPAFLVGLSLFVVFWVVWNSMAPIELRFDSADLGFIALTLMLSLQASYAAPMLLLAQNRQDDRDRVQIAQDRQRAERNSADLEYLAREIVALRVLTKDLASKDFIRAELRALLEDIEDLDDPDEDGSETISREQQRVSDSARRRAEAIRDRKRAAKSAEESV